MKVLIVEDEPRAANRLERMLIEIQPQIDILAKIPSVNKSVHWLNNHPDVDLIFLDVRLEDGESFEILRQIDITTPIIFCTAYSDYALKAFSVNSIDYLLKPVTRADLTRALQKYIRYEGYKMANMDWSTIFRYTEDNNPYRQQFLIPSNKIFTPLKTKNIIIITSYLKATKFTDLAGKEWHLDDTLSDIERDLDPAIFYRISRQVIVRLSHIGLLSQTDDGYYIKMEQFEEPLKVSRSKLKRMKILLGL